MRSFHVSADCLFSFPRGGELYVQAPFFGASDLSDCPWACLNDFHGASDAEVLTVTAKYPLLGGASHEAAAAERSAADAPPAGVAAPVEDGPRGAANSALASVADSDLAVGTKVEARYGSGSEWFGATISQVTASSSGEPDENDGPSDGSVRYFLQYDDGDVEEGARRLKIRLPGQHQRRKLAVSEDVDALCEALGGLVLPAIVVATPEEDASLQEDHYRVRFDAAAVSMVRQQTRGSSRGGSRGGARVKKDPEEEAVLNRKYIFGAFYAVSGAAATPQTKSKTAEDRVSGSVLSRTGEPSQLESFKVASAYFQRILPGSGRIFLLLPPSGSFLPGCGGGVLGQLYRLPSTGEAAEEASRLVQRYRRADTTVWGEGRMYLDMDDDVVTGKWFLLFVV